MPDHEPRRDDVTARLVAAGDPDGLRQLLQEHGGVVRARLRRDFGRILDDLEIDEAMGAMAVKVWHAAGRYDASKGTLRAWCAVIARNCALRLLELRKRRATTSEPDLDRFEQPNPAVALPAAERQRLLRDLHASIAELPTLQRAVALADLEAGGTAAAEPLAQRFATTTNSIYVSRLKARKALRKAMARRGHDLGETGLDTPRGTPPPPASRSEQG